jgi:hypothetical protein
MINLFVRGSDVLARLCYFAGRSRALKLSLLVACALSIATLGWARTARYEDTVVYSITSNTVRGALANRYVRVSGQFVLEGVYDTSATVAGLISHSVRFIPMSISGGTDPLYVLDEGLPTLRENQSYTLVGKLLEGDSPLPDYYLKVMSPPTEALFDVLSGLSIALLAGVVLGMVAAWLVRRADYALSIPFGLADGSSARGSSPRLLWFGSLGASYGDVVLRQIPISFKAIPAEAKLTPAGYPDLWSITIRRPYIVQRTAVSTSYGPMPAVRIQFEDERGITRDGVIAANKLPTLKAMLDVLRFVGSSS